MTPTTIANFEKELIQHFQMGYEIPKTEINQMIGEGRGSTNIIKERSRGYMAIICKKCGTIYPIKMKTNLNWNITSESDFETHFSAHVNFRGHCDECKMEHEKFTITYRDFAIIISTLNSKGYNTSLEYDTENDQFKLKIDSGSKYKNMNIDLALYENMILPTLRRCLETIVLRIPITWSYQFDYQNADLTLFLDRCNYIEGIYDMNHFVKYIPIYKYENKPMSHVIHRSTISQLYELNNKMTHPYIM